MTEKTQNTSSGRRLLKSAAKALGMVLLALAVVAVILLVVGIVLGVPAAITAYVVVTAYGMGGYLWAVGAQVGMGIIWFVIQVVLKLLGALAAAE